MDAPRCDQTEAWAALEGHYEAHGRELDLREAFARDPGRFASLSCAAPELFADLSKNLVDLATLKFLVDLARECRLEERRDAMFAGAPINSTEGRAVLHTALRAPRGQGPFSDEVHGVLDAMLAYAESVRDTAASGIRHVVNIGIGGSDLGPQMAVPALDAFVHPGLQFHFVANVDGHDITPVLRHLKPAETLFIVASKTFTTQETMANAASARARVVAALGEDAVGRHFAAVSTRLDKVAEFGIDASRVFGFWDWVGGRYSMWSSIGLALAIFVGPENFTQFLRGGHDIDEHFRSAPLERNIPALMGLLGVWHRNSLGRAAHAVIPYDQRLARFPAYLQQLDMESNGKSATRAGAPVDYETGPVIFGEPGTNGQHAFFQLLHQGTDVVPIDFLVAAEPTAANAHHHALLFSNCLAQAEAFMRGRTLEQAKAQLRRQGLSEQNTETLAPHKVFAGDRPSSVLLYKRLDPRTLGRLVALYEHKVFTQSVIWDINPFDQWGVELGKELANRLGPIVENDAASTEGLDASTAGLIQWRRNAAYGA